MTHRLKRADAKPRGQVLASSEGHVGGYPFDLTLTEHQLHFALSNGPAYAIDLKALAQAALVAIEEDLAKAARKRAEITADMMGDEP